MQHSYQLTNNSASRRRRRDVLKAGSLGLLGLTLPDLLRGRAMVQPQAVRGEFKPIATRVRGIDICEHFPNIATRTDKLAIVRSMTQRRNTVPHSFAQTH